ncbi:MAG: hypothetical protein IPK14_14100 [Blastocatellia bacterium]|nr:hypothetical protein [Blastocatellia bacterium]MBL8194829.1 hypothetical protein [Blastocatellia bacterium]MBN8725286.1 hypothetical protein [Acidobacteriota bacterium]
MSGPEREEPKLCQKCQEWLCSSKDAYCAYCGTALVVIKLSEENLVLSPAGAVLNISNSGLFKLYWAAEVLSPEPGIANYFSIRPDYGSIAPNNEQAFLVRLTNQKTKNLRAEIEIASNDPHRPIVIIPLLMEEIA